MAIDPNALKDGDIPFFLQPRSTSDKVKTQPEVSPGRRKWFYRILVIHTRCAGCRSQAGTRKQNLEILWIFNGLFSLCLLQEQARSFSYMLLESPILVVNIEFFPGLKKNQQFIKHKDIE